MKFKPGQTVKHQNELWVITRIDSLNNVWMKCLNDKTIWGSTKEWYTSSSNKDLKIIRNEFKDHLPEWF